MEIDVSETDFYHIGCEVLAGNGRRPWISSIKLDNRQLEKQNIWNLIEIKQG